jgi:glycerophosphoryl diester phosphodiesterase
VRLIAHRGFADQHPENTISAVRLAAERADAVEVDARRCASGEVVVIHDETVDRVTDGRGPVDGLAREELAALSVYGSGEGVPTLTEVAATLPEWVGLVLELKEGGIARDALDAVAGVEDLVVSSFLPDALAECREADPDIPTALNVAPGDAETGTGGDGGAGERRTNGDRETVGVDIALELDCAAVHPHHALCSPAYVRAAHDADVAVNAWTVDDRETARRLADAGVDGVIADRSDVLT